MAGLSNLQSALVGVAGGAGGYEAQRSEDIFKAQQQERLKQMWAQTMMGKQGLANQGSELSSYAKGAEAAGVNASTKLTPQQQLDKDAADNAAKLARSHVLAGSAGARPNPGAFYGALNTYGQAHFPGYKQGVMPGNLTQEQAQAFNAYASDAAKNTNLGVAPPYYSEIPSTGDAGSPWIHDHSLGLLGGSTPAKWGINPALSAWQNGVGGPGQWPSAQPTAQPTPPAGIGQSPRPLKARPCPITSSRTRLALNGTSR